MHDRITNIDAVRGSALFGILVVNAMVFSSPWYGTGLMPPGGRGPLDDALAFVISTVFELKFYLLFSFLFGYSVTLQMQSAERAEAAFLPRMLRRQAGLFLIGACHAVLLFHGDILATYAVLGLLLLMTRRWSDATRLWLAAAIILATAAFWLLLALLQASEPMRQDSVALQQHAEAVAAAFRGLMPSIVGQRLEELQSFLPMLLLLQAPCALAMFLLGFVAGHRRFFEARETYGAYLGRASRWGLLVGLPGGLAYTAAAQLAPGSPLETAALALSIVTSPFLTMALMAAMLTIFDSGRTGPWREYLASAGRMALSNYLLQSLACAFIFYGYGLGLIGRLSIAQTLGTAILIFGAQLLASHWWLRRFRYGPAEWLLRAMTIGQWPQWRADRHAGG
ncbi:uncharacterized protein HNP52_003913 [Sphingomonas kyeonggiensis]|uniref:DUF418 domain-containing protein n=1 Tax=Sphingomonas kyeonggiensis TaxID=1268553 RepID=A0A7W7K590_9SPHN|nr:DUF418 domain-containing protein [Sphingomonas kyeonggiensis]MBB4840816.1 uncharacterized protein [Sphingomonas kyeonggiensis]